MSKTKPSSKMTIPELGIVLTRHADDLQLFANGVSMDAYGELEQTEDAIMELVYQLYERYAAGGLPLEAGTQRYLEALKDKIEEIRENCFDRDEDLVVGQSREIVKNDSKFWRAFWFALTGAEAVALSSDWYTRISQYGVFNGGTVKQIFSGLAASDTKRIYDTMLREVRNGSTLAVARATVKKEMKKTKTNLKSEIDSIINGVAADVVLAFSAENNTVLLYSTALDARVCEVCRAFEGEYFPSNSRDIPPVPQHINCRCRLIPVPAASEQYKGLDKSFREYFEQLSEPEQAIRIGGARLKLLQDGEYALRNYEPPMPEQRVSLEELRGRDKQAFLRATNSHGRQRTTV